MRTTTARKTLGYVTGQNAVLHAGRRRTGPFFEIRLTRENVDELLRLLSPTQPRGRDWLSMIASEPDVNRLRLTSRPAPAFEKAAAKQYFRCQAGRVSGRDSCNIELHPDGAAIVVREMSAAAQRMNESLEMRVDRRGLIEFIPDVDWIAADSDEHARLAEASMRMASEAWGYEDFSDWEDAGGET